MGEIVWLGMGAWASALFNRAAGDGRGGPGCSGASFFFFFGGWASGWRFVRSTIISGRVGTRGGG